MKPKKIIFWAIFAILAYNFFSYSITHSSSEVIAYKRFAKALLKNDSYVARELTLDRNYALAVFDENPARQKLFGDNSIVFTYYVIKEQRVSDDEQTAFVIAEQVSRVNPKGQSTVWGTSEVRILHKVKLVKKNDVWKLESFHDPAMKP
ncbi:MAG: hypothetical protein ACSHX4_06140 [Opitutaceae bacterium]